MDVFRRMAERFGPIGRLQPEELKFLRQRFNSLDRDKSGQISVDEFKQIDSMAKNPLLERVINVFDRDNNGEVDFREFLKGVALFACPGYRKKKLKFLFQIYDTNKDGYLCHEELFDLIKLVAPDQMNDIAIHQVVHRTIYLNDMDQDGMLSFDEFRYCIEELLDAQLKTGFKILG